MLSDDAAAYPFEREVTVDYPEAYDRLRPTVYRIVNCDIVYDGVDGALNVMEGRQVAVSR